jgi:hypothetical protein
MKLGHVVTTPFRVVGRVLIGLGKRLTGRG